MSKYIANVGGLGSQAQLFTMVPCSWSGAERTGGDVALQLNSLLWRTQAAITRPGRAIKSLDMSVEASGRVGEKFAVG